MCPQTWSPLVVMLVLQSQAVCVAVKQYQTADIAAIAEHLRGMNVTLTFVASADNISTATVNLNRGQIQPYQ